MSSYGFSFGIELTADNVLASYFGDHFGLEATHAGDIAAVFGLINFVSRPLGKPHSPGYTASAFPQVSHLASTLAFTWCRNELFQVLLCSSTKTITCV